MTKQKFGDSAHEVELLEEFNILPIFNVANLYEYKRDIIVEDDNVK
jgi:hypothetical protein